MELADSIWGRERADTKDDLDGGGIGPKPFGIGGARQGLVAELGDIQGEGLEVAGGGEQVGLRPVQGVEDKGPIAQPIDRDLEGLLVAVHVHDADPRGGQRVESPADLSGPSACPAHVSHLP